MCQRYCCSTVTAVRFVVVAWAFTMLLSSSLCLARTCESNALLLSVCPKCMNLCNLACGEMTDAV